MLNEVIVIGSINYDNFLQVDKLPLKGETKHAHSFNWACGGKGANQAIQCAKLGLKTRMVGKVGNDSIGKTLLDNLKSCDVNCDNVDVVDGPSGMGYVISAEDGSLFSTILRGANWNITKDDIDKVAINFNTATIIVLQLEIPSDIVEYTIRIASSKGCKIVLNAAPAIPIDTELFNLCDLVIFNEAEAMYFTDSSFKTIEETKVAIRKCGEKYNCDLCFTIGPLGALYNKAGEILYYPAIDVPVVETTGAGDSFIGGLVYGLSHYNDVEMMLKFATVCSAFTIQGIGAQNSMPNLKDVLENINEIEKYE